jgi:hypothetical protein
LKILRKTVLREGGEILVPGRKQTPRTLHPRWPLVLTYCDVRMYRNKPLRKFLAAEGQVLDRGLGVFGLACEDWHAFPPQT